MSLLRGQRKLRAHTELVVAVELHGKCWCGWPVTQCNVRAQGCKPTDWPGECGERTEQYR